MDLLARRFRQMLRNEKIVLTLDVGGTNFVFSAYQNIKRITPLNKYLCEPNDLDKCLKIIVNGFKELLRQIKRADAISFSFPGPADYENGVIYNEGNLSAFSGGVALKAYLEEEFNIPVFINNDGDLFALGEAKYGLLQKINTELKEKNIQKEFKTLIGITLGTGYGGGVFVNGKMHSGDNSGAMEIWITRNSIYPETFIEESISKRAISREYGDLSLSAKEIYEIALGVRNGDKQKAIESFEKFGKAIGDSLANLITIFDGVVSIGGGITKAYELFMPSLLKALHSSIYDVKENPRPRIVHDVFSFANKEYLELLEPNFVKIPNSEKKAFYFDKKLSIVGISPLGASEAIGLGAYQFAIEKLDQLTCS